MKKIVRTFKKDYCLELLEYERLVADKYHQMLDEYDRIKHFELNEQLQYVKDYIIWKQTFSEYFKLFTNFENRLIDSQSFMDQFFDLLNDENNKKLLEDFILNSEDINIDFKSLGKRTWY